METAADSKGERLLSKATVPVVAAEFPLELRAPAYVPFDIQHHDLRSAARALLEKAGVGSFASEACSLEECEADASIFRSFPARKRLAEFVAGDEDFLAAYERLVAEVLIPWLKQHVATVLGQAGPTSFSYQYPPTLRVQPGRSPEFKRPHRDAEYGHQVGELNFWMPLTNYSEMTKVTLWVESQPEAGDYEPLAIDYGSIAMFHGTLCRHKVPANTSPYTRVSMDFRIGIGDYFDPNWSLDGVKFVHRRREIVL